MKKKEKAGKTGNAGSNRKLIIACFCAVLFMIVVTVGSMILFKFQIAGSAQVQEMEQYQKYSKYYVMISGDRKSSLWQSAYEGAKEAAAGKDAYVEMLGMNLSEEYSEMELMRIAIDSDVDGIILMADESEGMKDLIDEAVNKGIPVVTALGDSSVSQRKSYVGISSYNLGREYGKQVCEIEKDLITEGQAEYGAGPYRELDVLVLMNTESDDSGQNIVFSGIQDAVKEDAGYPELVNLKTVAISSDGVFAEEESIRDIFMDSKNLPDIIICLDELNTTCVYQAVVDYNKVGQINILGYYDSDTILNAIERDVIYATIHVDTRQIGKYSVEALDEYKETGHVSEYFVVDTSLITKDNVQKYLGEEENEETN